MKIAVIGSGIAGNVAAYHLSREHDITVFEAASHVGGHTHTHDIEHEDQTVAVDTGFIVCNDRNYPNFLALMSELGVELQPSEMSFSVQTSTGLEYNGTTLNSLFAQRRNLLRPGFWRMIRDILRFNREAPRLLDSPDDSLRLGDYLDAHDYSPQFVEHYILPMGAAIWSAGTNAVRNFPARYFVRFFHNHGMLTVDDRPQWHTVRGGSARYVEKLTAGFRDRIRLRTPVESVRRSAAGADEVVDVLENRPELHAGDVRDTERLIRGSVSACDRLIDALHPWSSYVIVPIFALANAGIVLSSDTFADPSAVLLGVTAGLVVGKLVGVVSFSWLAVRLGLGRLPGGTRWRHVVGVGAVAGIGFTVSLFITGLALESPELQADAKTGILVASVVAAALGAVVFRIAGRGSPGEHGDGE